MSKALKRLHTDHQRMGRVLTALRDQCRKDPLDVDLDHFMCMLDYIAEYPDRIHHPLEDRLFANMLDQHLSDEERADVEKNAASHEVLTAATQTLVKRIDQLEGGLRSPAAPALLKDVDAYVSEQFDHMNFEESVVFKLAERHLDDRAWEALDRKYVDSLDPAFDLNEQRFAALFHYVVPDASYGEPVVKGPPTPASVPPGYTPSVVQLAGTPNQLGAWTETLEALSKLAADQQRLFFEDASQSFTQAMQGNVFWPFDHMQRRVKHLSEGFQRSAEIVTGGRRT